MTISASHDHYTLHTFYTGRLINYTLSVYIRYIQLYRYITIHTAIQIYHHTHSYTDISPYTQLYRFVPLAGIASV